MDDPATLCSECGQHISQKLHQLPSPHTNNLPGCAGRIAEWPQQIERRVNAQFLTNGGDARRSAVIEGRKHKTNSDFVQAGFSYLRQSRYVDTKRGQHISTSRFAADGAITVLGDSDPGAGRYKRRRG